MAAAAAAAAAAEEQEEDEDEDEDEEQEVEDHAGDNYKRCRNNTEDPGDQFYKELTLQMQNNNDSCGAFGTLIGMKLRELDKSVHTVVMARILTIITEYEKK